MHIHTSEQEPLELGFGAYTCNWGAHMCGLYETPEERDQILFGFLRTGGRTNDLRLYCPAERSVADFERSYAQRYPDGASEVHDLSRFRLASIKALYYPTGIFSPWDMDRNLQAFYEESQRDGRRNVRATAEMVWALEAVPGVEHLMVYESRLNYFIPGKPWISICLYNMTKFTGSQIMNVLRTHPFSISAGVITENPYYMDPDDYLATYAPDFCGAAAGTPRE